MMTKCPWMAVLLGVLALAACRTPPGPVAKADLTVSEKRSLERFQETVRRVLEHRCLHCHHAYAVNGGLKPARS